MQTFATVLVAILSVWALSAILSKKTLIEPDDDDWRTSKWL